jgi:hypothetical protein
MIFIASENCITLYASPPRAIERELPSVLSAITLLSSLLIQPDFETNQTDQVLYSFESIIFSNAPPVFPARKTPASIAQTVAGQIILRLYCLFNEIISLVSLSGTPSAMMIIFLNKPEMMACLLAFVALLKLAKFTRVSIFLSRFFGISS